MRQKIRTTVTTKTRREITFRDLRSLLGLPEDATIFVRVPGGGDWSNTDLEINDCDRPLIVTFQTVEEKYDET